MRQRELESKAKRLRQQLNNVNAILNRMKAEKALPELKAKYLGKYFKCRNCYSMPEKESDYWFIYFHVKTVDGEREMYATKFEVTKDGKIEIEASCDFWCSASDITEITAEEYQKAIAELRIDLAKILR